MVGPLVIFLLSRFGKKTCTRFYQRFLEDVTISVKIEDELGLHNSRRKSDQSVFNKDNSYFPERWVDDRKKFQSSEDFINNRLKEGVNKYIILTFNFGILISIAGFITILYKIYHI
jgi:hypothetical protein